MNQERIGKYIQGKRKIKKLTQEELASILGVSTNAVSKWERGLCLMDMSLLKPLSEALDISINEILAGEDIDSKNLLEKSEENIINLSELIELKSIKYGVIGMALFFMLLTIISAAKGISPSALTSLICAYNSTVFLSRYKLRKDKTELFTGSLFLFATICNTIAFIVS